MSALVTCKKEEKNILVIHDRIQMSLLRPGVIQPFNTTNKAPTGSPASRPNSLQVNMVYHDWLTHKKTCMILIILALNVSYAETQRFCYWPCLNAHIDSSKYYVKAYCFHMQPAVWLSSLASLGVEQQTQTDHRNIT